MKSIQSILGLLTLSLAVGCTPIKKESSANESQANSKPTNRVVLSSEIQWEALNPARGEQSPLAGTIWGDRNGSEPTGFLAKFKKGFSSPPHIHNVTYRALVINGLIHNDDPNAEKMWMPAGSFWTQPAGESHITAAADQENIVYVEIDKGPYLVKPIEEAFDNGERAVNIDKTNIVWLDASRTSLIEKSTGRDQAKGPEVAFLWENGGLSGTLLKLPSGFRGEIISHGDIFHAVIIIGNATYEMPGSKEIKTLDPGSYFSSVGRAIHRISIQSGEESTVYIQTDARFGVR